MLAVFDSRSDDANTVLDQQSARFMRLQQPQAVEPDAAAAEKTPNGELVFTVRGATRARAHWIIPVNLRLPVKGTLEFSAQAVNLAAVGDSGNLYLMLQRLPGRTGPAQKVISAFTALGREGRERGRVGFDLGDQHYFLHSIHVDLYVDKPGDASLQLNQLRLSFDGNPMDAERRDQILARPPSVRAEVRDGPTWVINGRPLATISGMTVAPAMDLREIQAPLLESGLRVNRLPLALGGPDSLWSHLHYFDVPRLRELLARADVKGGWLLLDIDLSSPPPWWTDQTEPGLSDFDPAWRRYCQEAVSRLLSEVRQSPWDPHVIGISLHLGPHQSRTALPARAEHSQYIAAFRKWLAGEYADDAGLQAAWKDPRVSLATAIPAAPEQWGLERLGLLRHPQASRHDLDSWVFWNRSWLDFQLVMAQFIKDKTNGQYLCGIENGPAHLLAPFQVPRLDPGFATLQTFLESPAIDFLQVALTPADLEPQAGALASQFLIQPLLRRHRKLLIARVPGEIAKLAADKPASLDRLRRLQIQALTAGIGLIFDDLDPAVLKDRATVEALAGLNAWTSRLVREELTPPQIAFVIDPDVGADLPPDPQQVWTPARLAAETDLPKPFGTLQADLLQVPRRDWARLGAAYDIVTIDQLDPTPYRMLIFFHTIRMTPERLKRLEQARGDGRTLVWVWANALFHQQSLALSQMGREIGMTVNLSLQPQRLFQKPDQALVGLLNVEAIAEPLGARVLPGDADRIANAGYAPNFVIADPNARLLAVNADTAEPAMALRQFANWTSLYSVAPALNPEILRGLAAKAGVSLVLETNDPVFLAGPFIGLYSQTSGKRQLRLEKKEALYEVFHQRTLKPAREHTVELEGGQTYLFFRGGKEKWDAVSGTVRMEQP